jgi:hypothetical protein
MPAASRWRYDREYWPDAHIRFSVLKSLPKNSEIKEDYTPLNFTLQPP